MHDCGNCSGQCSGCGGCGGCLTMTEEEIHVLRLFAQTPFLPVARRADSVEPIFLEEQTYSVDTYTLILQHLEAKRLIRIDYDQPLSGADMTAYSHCRIFGSMALTARGQQVLDYIEIQGVQ